MLVDSNLTNRTLTVCGIAIVNTDAVHVLIYEYRESLYVLHSLPANIPPTPSSLRS